jgi:deoxyribonuclease V
MDSSLENTLTHGWNVDPKSAIEIQKRLASKVELQPLGKETKYIAGADVSMNLYSKVLYAGIVVFTYPDLVEVDRALFKGETSFPYIPGLLSFREIPSLLECWEKIKIKPDVTVVDGVGIAHPRRLGIASHFGVLTQSATIGCAKSLLTGIVDEPEGEPGSISLIHDSKNSGEIIGASLRTKKNCKPIFISTGHRITLSESVDTIKNCVRGFRIPEPTRRAHTMVNEFRTGNIFQ